MTRELEIAVASCAYGSKGSSFDFEAGAKWADIHPKSPWISVKNDLPYNHEELISTQDKATKKVIVMDKYDGAMVDFMKRIKSGLWYWSRSVNVLYWMPIPELPKE